MTDIQHRFAAIYDKLNDQPDLQELIATPLLGQLDLEDSILDEAIYHMRAKCWQDLTIYILTSVIDHINWDTDLYEGSFAAYVLYILKP